MTAQCADCGRRYGDRHGFPDLVIEQWAWDAIAPDGNGNGLLCPDCICQRLSDAGLTCYGAFTSGPIKSVSEATLTGVLAAAAIRDATRAAASNETSTDSGGAGAR